MELDLIEPGAKAPVATAPAKPGTAIVTTIKDAALARFSAAEVTLRALAERYRNVAFNVKTASGLDDAKKARHDLRENGRFAVQRIEKAVKDEVNDLKRTVGAEAERLVAIVKAREDEIDAIIEAREQEIAAEKAEKKRKEEARIAAHKAAIAEIASFSLRAVGFTAARLAQGVAYVEQLDTSKFEEFTGEADRTKESTLASLRALHTAAAAREAEAARLEEQRIENERVAAELAARQRKLDEQAAAAAPAPAPAPEPAPAPAPVAPVAPTVTVGQQHAIVADAKSGEIHTIDGVAPGAAESDSTPAVAAATAPPAKPPAQVVAEADETGPTRGPWRRGKYPHSIVADCPVPGIKGSENIEAYGGYLIAESVAPQNMPLLIEAPAMLALLRELIDIEGQQPGTAAWAKKVNALIARVDGGAA